MRSIGWMLLAGVVVLIGGGYFMFTKKQGAPPATLPIVSTTTPTTQAKEKKEIPSEPIQKTMPLSIESTAFSTNGTIPARFTCDGKNISPELVFGNVPAGTQSLALTLEDPDVPRTVRADGMWDHWVVWNMPPTTVHIAEGATPSGLIGKGTNGKASYLGPCPPDREHRYFFTLYALDATLSLPQGATKEELLKALAPHLIEKATLIGRYDRN